MGVFNLVSLFSLLSAVACSGERTDRKPVPAQETDSSAGSADATATGGSSGQTSGSVGGGSGGQSVPLAKSLEQCSAEQKAWRAVVDSGASPTDCIESLVSWCCTRDEVLKRFPTVANVIDGKFKDLIDQQQFVLYHCSFDGQGRYTFHLANIKAGVTNYKVVYVSGITPVSQAPVASCPVVTTDTLKIL